MEKNIDNERCSMEENRTTPIIKSELETITKVSDLVEDYNIALGLLKKVKAEEFERPLDLSNPKEVSEKKVNQVQKQALQKKMDDIQKSVNEIIRENPIILDRLGFLPFDVDTKMVHDTFEGDIFNENCDFKNKSKAVARLLRDEKVKRRESSGTNELKIEDSNITDTASCSHKKVLELTDAKNVTMKEDGENIKISAYSETEDITVEYTIKKLGTKVTYENGMLIVEKISDGTTGKE